jgi:hypothetical protein
MTDDGATASEEGLVRHSRQDAFDTAARRKSTAPASAWHPILAAEETAAGHWVMIDTTNNRYGVIRFLTIGGESGYRAVTWADRGDDRRLIGYFTTLRAAAAATHREFLRKHGHSLP